MSNLKNYSVKTGDWRRQLQKNRKRTFYVIAIFIALYITLGLIVDTIIYVDIYNVPAATIFYALITLKLFPYATVTMGAVAAISLLVTYSMYDKIMLLGTTYHEVLPDKTQDLKEQQLYNVVEEMKVASGLQYMPKVFIIEANYMNAFASGYSEKSAMVAITRGLMNKLDRSEMQAVMAHELSHIRHQDIKLTLTASVLSNIMLIVLDILFYKLIFSGRRSRGDGRLFIIIILLRYILPIITVLLMFYLSRTREFMADAGCVELMRDNEPLAKALLKIHEDHHINQEEYRYEYGQTAHEDVRRASYLYDPIASGAEPVKSFTSMFSTHPDIRDRLKAIGITLK